MIDNNAGYKTVSLVIPDQAAGERLDRYLGHMEGIELTRSKIQKLVEDGLVMVDNYPAGHNQKLKGGEIIIINIPPTPVSDIRGEEIPLDIVYEDEYLIVVNKPAGMVTHPGAGNFSGTLVNAVLHHTERISNVQGRERAGIVHRLDRNTSGLVMIARDDKTHLALQKQLKERRVEKTYLAIVCGHMKEETGIIDLPIGRSLKDRKKMAVTYQHSRPARTEYRLLERFRLYDFLEIKLETGRTHQIRVHFSHLGHPLLGDPEYGGRTKWHRGIYSADKIIAEKALAMIDRQALHAGTLGFTHPVTGKILKFNSPLPGDMAKLLDYLRTEGA
nr:RluA family pseudouridine synthase [candidate division Zixibacteria bacterium]